MANNTKERILDAALEIFARDGYAGTNIKDIAESVGIVKSALYKHFESKEAIWEAVKNQIATYYETQVGTPDNLPEIPQTMDELFEFTMKTVDFTIHDQRVVQVRKVLMTEQFRDEKTRDLANAYFLYRTEAMFTRIFTSMMQNGAMKKGDPELLAFSYTAPITALIHLCDRDPKREPEAMEKLQRYIRSFVDVYKQG